MATKVAVPFLALVAGLALLAMHALSIRELALAMHTAEAHTATASDQRIGRDAAPMGSHMHELVGCLWIVVDDLTIAPVRQWLRA